MKLFASILIILLLRSVESGPLAYGVCQSVCCAGAVACYAAAGFTFGTVGGNAASPILQGCNKGLASCSQKCVILLRMPTP